MTQIRKLLIANRGEIAIRIARTCRSLGISTVALYSDDDVDSLHVRVADEAVHIGASQVRDSYLNIEKIVDAAVRSGADAIHPGYGFLSEKAEFAKACAEADLIFIGPSAEVIQSMGFKSEARRIMAAAGVPVVTGYEGSDQSVNGLCEQALGVGLPVLIKASAGGGGKGMRVVREASRLPEDIESAQRESQSAFGDPTLLIEKYIENARHVEVQILGDNQGNLIHLFERECSIQRRHQKVIEESPSPGIDEGLRRKICESAVAAARAIRYTNAGTVEFIVAPSSEYYFIEVNTRLQVEHPVTEMTTGLDLVGLQIEVAEGKPLSIAQSDVVRSGHAIEARLYAEDPRNSFLPATGALIEYREPHGIEGVRIDSGVDSRAVVGIHYDPLLAKIIAFDSDRDGALRRMAYALDRLVVLGVTTNREFLSNVIRHQEFQSGTYATSFIDSNLDQLTACSPGEGDVLAAIAVLWLHKLAEMSLPIRVPADFRNNPFRDPSIRIQIDGKSREISWRILDDRNILVRSDDWQAKVELVSFETGRLRAAIDGIQREFKLAAAGDQVYVQSSSSVASITRLPRYPRAIGASEHESAYAPMPGQVLKVLVEAGQKVKAGAPLVVLEAMKMEQTLRAAADGIIEAVLVKPGDVVAPGDAMVEITAIV